MEYSVPNFFFDKAAVCFLPKCHSTNNFALELIRSNKAHEGMVVVTDWQTDGRGQRGNTWEAMPGSNLTFSLILQPHYLPVMRQFDLNMAVAPAVAVCVSELCPGVTAEVKWPNDIMLNGLKTAGILIENVVKNNNLAYAVVGIGFNLNQREFETDNATSPCLVSGKEYDRAEVLQRLLYLLYNRVLTLQNEGVAGVKPEFIHRLFLKNTPALYKETATGKQFVAAIYDVSPSGTLLLTQSNGALLEYGFKEIVYCGVYRP